MRISPTALALRNATDSELYRAVAMSCLSSHVHPEAIDAAFLQAKAISILLETKADEFRPEDFLFKMIGMCRTRELKSRLEYILGKLKTVEMLEEDVRNVQKDEEVLQQVCEDFQLKAVDAQCTAFWYEIFYTFFIIPKKKRKFFSFKRLMTTFERFGSQFFL